jgi:hypothetical protein
VAVNLITVPWAAWRANPAEGADPITTCAVLADVLQQCLDSTGETPVPAAWGYAVQQPTGVWPNLIVTPDRGRLTMHTLDQCSRAHEGHYLANFIFGPATGDVLHLEQAGALYKDAVDEALSANQTLDGAAHGARITGAAWGDKLYAGGAWYMLECYIDVLTVYARRPQYINDF